MINNHIIKKKAIGSVFSGGKTFVLSAATQTDYLGRLESMADKLKAPLEKAVDGKEPSWADEFCARHVLYRQASHDKARRATRGISNHESQKDP